MNESLPPSVDIAAGKPTRMRYQILTAACIMAVIVYIHRVGFARALPELTRDLGLEDRHAGWLTAAFLVAYGGFEMPWGLAGDRWGTRLLLPLIVLGWSVVTGMVALAETFGFLLALRFLFGFFQAGAFPLLSRMMTDWMPTHERGKAQGFIWMATRLGGMVSPLLVGGLIAWLGGWRMPLWLIATLGVAWAAAFLPWFRNRPEETRRVNDAERWLIESRVCAPTASSSTEFQDLSRPTPSTPSARSAPYSTEIQELTDAAIKRQESPAPHPATGIQQTPPIEPGEQLPSRGPATIDVPARSIAHGPIPWRRFLRSRSVWSLCLMYGCGGFAANFYVTLLPTYLRNHRQLDQGDTNLLASLPFFFGAVACLFGGLLSDAIIRNTGNRQWGRRFNGTVGTIIAGFGWLAINWVDSTWALAFVLCLIFFCNDFAMGPAWAACSDIGERYAGTLGGAMNMIGNLAGAVGGIITGYLFESRPEWVFVIFAISFWCGTLCWQGVDATERLTAGPD